MLRCSRLFSFFAGLLSALVLPAQGQNLIELYQSARSHDPLYQGARAQYDASLARAAQAEAIILPTVGLTTSVTRTNLDIDRVTGMRQGSNSRGYTAQNGGVNATQPLFRPAHWAVYQEGKLLAAAAETVLKTAKQDLIVRVSQAYFDVLKSRDTLALVGAQKLAVAEQLASAKRSFAVGTASITDSREAQARYDLVISQEITAATDLQVKSDALDQLVL